MRSGANRRDPEQLFRISSPSERAIAATLPARTDGDIDAQPGFSCPRDEKEKSNIPIGDYDSARSQAATSALAPTTRKS